MDAPATLEFAPAMHGIAPAEWDALAGDQPFVQHAFLHGLEATGCVGPGTGWTPMHALLRDSAGLAAAMPLYAKTHSYGEFVFDWAWADAYARHGLAYYPKLLCAIPFTPVPGPRVLGRSAALRAALLEAVIGQVRQAGWSSLHLLFPTGDALAEHAAHAGMLTRHHVQFHWTRAGESDFEGFLARLNAEKRKKIRQERRKVREAGVQMRWITGRDIGEADWAFFYRCYADTYALRGNAPYLQPGFFLHLGDTQPDACVLVVASRGGRDIAASLMLRDTTTLYGRYWGALERLPCLHFEACYYQGIEYALALGLQRFEGGAQGEHKLARGLAPVRTASLHWLGDPRFRHAVADYLARERGGMEAYLDELDMRAPFRRGTDPTADGTG